MTKKILSLALMALSMTTVTSAVAGSDVPANVKRKIERIIRKRVSGKDITIEVEKSETDLCGGTAPNYIATVYLAKMTRAPEPDGSVLVLQPIPEMIQQFSIEPAEIAGADAELHFLEKGHCW